MKKHKWIKTNDSWGPGLPTLTRYTENMNIAIVGSQPEHETCIAGRYGEIWEDKPGTYRVFFKSYKIANRASLLLGKTSTYKKGDEPVLSFPQNNLLDIVTLIKCPKSPGTRARLCNEFKNAN